MGHRWEGQHGAQGLRLAIAASRWNDLIVKQLVDGALHTVRALGGDPDAVDIAYCPGAVELPLVAQRLCTSRQYDAVIALGCVIRGGTPHFDTVVSIAASGLARAAQDSGVPVSFGVLTVDTIEQAIERSGTKMGNKGAEATVAAIELANLLRQLPGSG
jgi:6,7-dimethyl-8-ribityllumazine synthase